MRCLAGGAVVVNTSQMTEFQFVLLYAGMGILLVIMCCHPSCRVVEPGNKSSDSS